MDRITLITVVAVTMAGCGQPPGPSRIDQMIAADAAASHSVNEQHRAAFSSRQVVQTVPPNLQAQSAAYIKDSLKDPDSAHFRYEIDQAVGGRAYQTTIGGQPADELATDRQ